MRLDYITSVIGIVLMYFGALFLFPIFVAIYYSEYTAILPFLVGGVAANLFGLFLYRLLGTKTELKDIRKKEALCIVACLWILFSLFASIPFLFFGFPLADAIFEATSGISTCGASILTDFSMLPKSGFFWRSFCQWLGGIGIIVIFIAVLPQFAFAGRQFFFSESALQSNDKNTFRVQYYAYNLLAVYLILSISAVIALKCAGMPLFDSVCNMFSMISAGGLSPHPKSISGYHSNAIVWVCIVFMFLAGVNFTIQYKVIFQRNFKILCRNSEYNFYFIFFTFASILVTILITLDPNSVCKGMWLENFRNSLFHTLSIMTSTGFYCVDHDLWDSKAKMVLISLMFVGASAGSAGGGLKIARIVYVMRFLLREVKLLMHPKAIIPIKLDQKSVAESIGQQIISFVFLYFAVYLIIGFIVTMVENDILKGYLATAITLGNTGLGFAPFGPTGGFAHMSTLSKYILSLTMIIGRLELIPFLIIFNKDYWHISKK